MIIKIILQILLLILFSCSSQAQDAIIFKINFNPEKKYNIINERKTHIETKYIGSEKILRKLEDNGIQNPTITDEKFKIEYFVKTGKLKDSLNFPLIIEEMVLSGNIKELDRMLAYGHSSIGNMPIFDSIVSSRLDDEVKKTTLQTMQNSFADFFFPERQIQVGDSFSREALKLTYFAGMPVEFNLNYKLVSITNGIANFDISCAFTSKFSITEYTFNATGSGKGELLYDISNNFFIKYENNIKIYNYMKSDKFDGEMNATISSLITTDITTN